MRLSNKLLHCMSSIMVLGRCAMSAFKGAPRQWGTVRDLEPTCGFENCRGRKITPRFALLRERSEEDPLPPTRFQPSSLPCVDTVELSVREQSRQAQQPKVGSSHLL